MALTFLSLVNKALRRLNEVELTSVTFPTATGFQSAVKDFVNEAVYDINIAEMEWPFNLVTGSDPAAINDYVFTMAPAVPGSHAAVDWDSFYSYDTVNNITIWMRPLDYDEWRQRFFELTAPFTSTGQPCRIVQVPNDNTQAYIWPPPDTNNYVIGHEEYALPAAMVAYNDTTKIPDAFEQVIIDKVLQYSYEFRSNEAMATRVDGRYKLGLSTMRTYLLNRFIAVRDTRVNQIFRGR